MLKRILTIILVVLFVCNLFSQNDDKINELEKRLIELEKQNKELQEDVDSTKRENSNGVTLVQKTQWGDEVCFEISGGQQGIYSQATLGIFTPRIKNFFRVGFKFNFSGSQIYLLTYKKDTNDLIKHAPMIVGGNLVFNFSSPLLFNFMRIYGNTEFLFGWTFNGAVNYGSNFTFGGFGYGGIEFYTSKYAALFIEAGGGSIYGFSIDKNQYIADNPWAGSGFGIKLGTRIYFANKDK